MSSEDYVLLLRRIAEALERIVYLLETEPINVKIPNLHPSATAPTLEELRMDLSDEEADRFFKAINESNEAIHGRGNDE